MGCTQCLRFISCVLRFLVQFGCSLDAEVAAVWAERPAIPDDPLTGHPFAARGFSRGMVAFAGTGPHSRTDQLFIAFEDSEHLGREAWETPIGVVTKGMDALETMTMYVGQRASGCCAWARRDAHTMLRCHCMPSSGGQVMRLTSMRTRLELVLRLRCLASTNHRYGDFPAFGGNGPDPDLLRGPGAGDYLATHFRDMDFITECRGHLPVDAHGNEVRAEL